MRRCFSRLAADPAASLIGAGRPFEIVAREVRALRESLHQLVEKKDNEVVSQAVDKILESQGKLLRPALVALMAHALLPLEVSNTCRAAPQVVEPGLLSHPLGRILRLAQVTELIHCASLVHDDVMDNSETRRGRPALHKIVGAKHAVLVGDFLLARASYWIATLEQSQVVMLMTKALEDLTTGEILQDAGCFNLPTYFKKTYCKTASLMDRSLSATALLVDSGNSCLFKAASGFGTNIGVAFQIVDDCLDLTGNQEEMGKPTLADAHDGIATLPILLAAEKDEHVAQIVRRKFSKEGDVEKAVDAVKRFETTAEALNQAGEFCKKAVDALAPLHASPAKEALESAVQIVLKRQL